MHKHIDLTGSPDSMAKDLQDVSAEYVFFAAYLAKDDEGEATKVNGDMLENFLKALQINGADKKLKRVILTTGAKQYGLHLGRPKNPMEESDPWLRQSDRPPNFYYRQQDILRDYAQPLGYDWVVTYPNDVIGVAHGNFMNLSSSLGLYVAVTKELGQDLVFPGSKEFYTSFDVFTYSRLHAQFNTWAALEPAASNQAFNVVNGDVESWQNMWPKVAKKFGMKVKEDQFVGEAPDASVMEMHERPPIQDQAPDAGLKGTEALKQSAVEQRIDLVKWSQKDEVKKAWQRLAEREGLKKEAFEQATWGFLGFVLGRNFDIVISMSKARKMGWTGYVDSWDCLSECFDELVREGVLPRFRAGKVMSVDMAGL